LHKSKKDIFALSEAFFWRRFSRITSSDESWIWKEMVIRWIFTIFQERFSTKSSSTNRYSKFLFEFTLTINDFINGKYDTKGLRNTLLRFHQQYIPDDDHYIEINDEIPNECQYKDFHHESCWPFMHENFIPNSSVISLNGKQLFFILMWQHSNVKIIFQKLRKK
jgi:hypothetical protein